MTKKKKNQPVVTPIITGIHKEKEKLELHIPPEDMLTALADLCNGAKGNEVAEMLFNDVYTLVDWAYRHLKIENEPKENEPEAEEDAPDSNKSSVVKKSDTKIN